jgi:hypothetical protein
MAGKKSFENPLLSHARMRAMYRALVETRLLGKRTRDKSCALPAPLEACFVGTAIDLQPADLVSLAMPAPLLEHIRRAGTRDSSKPLAVTEARRTITAIDAAIAPRELAPMERLLCAIGSAIALHEAGSHEGGNQAALLAYVAENDLSAAEWKRLFTLFEAGQLPLILVTLPALKGKDAPPDLHALARRAEARNVPVIPVDAGDAVALYRVTQESVGRARGDQRVAVIQCVDCGVDPVALLGRQLLAKGIASERWIAAVEPSTGSLLARL